MNSYLMKTVFRYNLQRKSGKLSKIVRRTTSNAILNGQSDKEEAADIVYNASLHFLKADECERVKGQLSDVAQDIKEERQQIRSRGFHL